MSDNTFNFLTIHNFRNIEIRTTKKQNGSIWFSVNDVCQAIDIDPALALEDIDPTHQATFIMRDGNNDLELDMISATRLKVVTIMARTDLATEFYQWVRTEITGQSTMDDGINLSFTFHNSKDHEIRTIVKDDGSVWFVAKDVCKTLDLQNSRQAIAGLDEDEKASVSINDTSLSSRNNITVQAVSESGLYMLIFRSRKPEARKFRKWVTSEVLPQIRRTGAYLPALPAKIEPAAVSDSLTPTINRKAITAFLQSATDTFWEIETVINEFESMRLNLRKARKDTSRVIRSIKQAFPDIADSVDLVGGKISDSRLEVEIR